MKESKLLEMQNKIVALTNVMQQIINEIKRIAASTGGKPPGVQFFERHTGIKRTEWWPDLWLRWGDALAEAGFAPRELQAKIDDSVLLEKYIDLVRELSKFPVMGELRRKAKYDKSFPSHTVFGRFGGKDKLIEAVASYCKENSGVYEDVGQLCETYLRSRPLVKDKDSRAKFSTGFVYLMKSGRHYKIGRTNAIGRREWELGIKIPVPPRTIHTIETDDPVGVEAYWHKRFNDKRGEGEWFELTAEDIRAFKRWKRIV